MPITGTPFNLVYNTDKTPGYLTNTSLKIPLTKSVVPDSLERIEVTVDVAGRRHTFEYEKVLENGVLVFPKNLIHDFTWDGLDAYGRQVSGTVKAKVRIQYFNESQKAFETEVAGAELIFDEEFKSYNTRINQPFVREYTTNMEVKDHRANGLGGWSIDANHVYDARGEILHMGNGTRMSSQDLPDVITVVNGGQVNTDHIAADSKGNIYFSDTAGHEIKKIDLQGTITTVVGTGTEGGRFPNDPVAPLSDIDSPTYLAFDIHDNLYFYDSGNYRIRKVDFTANEMVSIVGTGNSGNPITNATPVAGTGMQLKGIGGLAIDHYSRIYFIPLYSDLNIEARYRVLRLDRDGFVRLHFGEFDETGYLVRPVSMTSDPEGNLYIADKGRPNDFTEVHVNPHVFKLTNLGVFVKLAGDGEDNDATAPNPAVDGVPGTESPILPTALAFRDGKLYIAEVNRVRVVTADGIISTIAGPGDSATGVQENYPAVSSEIEPVSIAFDLLGNPLVADATSGSEGIRRIASPLPSLLDGTVKIPSSDGSLLYEFDNTGRHQNTKSTLTGATLLTFNYDADGKLDNIVDGDGDTTDFVYDANGDLEKIVSEDGLETLTEPDGHGFIASITYPNTLYDEVIDFEYDPNGLMESMDDAKGNTHLFRYDSNTGQLLEDENPEGGILQLARETIAPGEYKITTTSPEGRIDSSSVKTLSDSGKRESISTDTSGFETTTTLNKDQSTTAKLPNETEITATKKPDERFNFISPLAALSVKLPSTNELNLERKRTFTGLTNPDEPLTYTTVKEELIIGQSPNERIFESVFTKATKKFETKSATTPPRVTTTEIDDLERVTKSHIDEIIDAEFKYDSRGRLEFIRQGCESETSCNDGRETGIAYDTNGFVQSVTDALGQVTSFKYDKLGRVTEQTLPTSPGILARKVAFEYDQNGNLESLTPPGRPSHTYLHTALDLEKEYTPPDHPEISIERTKYDYNADKQPELITRPDNQTIDLNYDTGGRLKEYITPDGTTEFKYFETATDTESFGNLKSITALGTPNEALTFAYDGTLPTSTTWGGTVAGVVSQDYDDSFRVESRTVTDGASPSVSVVERFAYDEDNLLESVKYDPDGTAGNGDEFELDLINNSLNGLLTGTEMKDNTSPTPAVKVTDEYKYFNANAVAPEPNDKGYGEVYEYKATVTGNGELFKTVFDRDKLGRILKKTETLNGSTTHVYEYTYYPEGMLKTVTIDSGTTITYRYDANFNRLNIDGGATNDAEYDVQDRLESYAGNTYAYNDNGELASKTNASGTTTYTYDVLGNLRQVDPPLANDAIDYVIDASNRRVAKKVDGTITRKWLYGDQLNPIAELDLNNNITKRFIYGTRSNVPDVMVDVSGANPVVYRIISDHLGSPRFVIDISNGTTALELDYDEWGVETVVSGNRDLIPFGFAGGLYDKDTKLVRFGARDYDPETGRWTSKDPIEFEGGDTNLFGYVLNDPVNFIDQTGKSGKSVTSYGKNLVRIVRIPLTPAQWAVIACELALEYFVFQSTDDGTPDIIVDTNGVAVWNSTEKAREDLENAGFPGSPTTDTKEVGTVHRLPGRDVPMDVRVMEGQANRKQYKGPRIATEKTGTGEDMRTDGTIFRRSESKAQRREESHIHLVP